MSVCLRLVISHPPWGPSVTKTPNTTTTADLPPELWLEILSYLPRHCLWNMSGVNHTFYALVLPETFRQLNLAHSNTRAMSHLNK